MPSIITKVKDKLHDRSEKNTSSPRSNGESYAPSNSERTQSAGVESEGGNYDSYSDPTPIYSGKEERERSDSAQEPDVLLVAEREGCMKAHNRKRVEKGNSELVWDEELAGKAQAYAEELSAKDTLQHSGMEGQGENLFMSSGDATYQDAVNAWMAEESKYSGEKIGEGDFGDWGHFTQCMWHSTEKVGMGKARSKNGGTYVVARYTPQGNMGGEKPF